jgi:hypothetical protein
LVDDVTDESRVASTRIEASCPPVEARQLVAQRPKLGDPGIELGCPAPDQVHHEATRRLAPVPKGDLSATGSQNRPADQDEVPPDVRARLDAQDETGLDST